MLRGYAGTDLADHTANVATIACPFTGEELTAVAGAAARRGDHPRPAGRPRRQRAALGHHRRAEGGGARRPRSLVTVEEVVDELDARPGAVVLPSWVVTAVAEVPGGAAPSYAHGYSVRDNAAYAAWDGISRDRDAFLAWMQDHVLDLVPTGRDRRAEGDPWPSPPRP